MAKPLRSDNPQPQDLQFKHFGVMSSGEQSKTSLFTSITVNVLLALIIVIIGAAAKKVVIDKRKAEAIYPVAIKEKPPEPPKPKLPPPPPPKIKIPPPPEVPKIKLPDVLPEPPKPVEVKIPKPPTPVVTPAPPKMVVAAAAPKVISVKLPAVSASVKNNDAHPTAVALGHPDNPIAVSNRPATASVNLGNAGQPGMQASNTGRGPVSPVSLGGNGQPNGSLNGGGPRAIAGVKLGGVTGGDPNSKGGNGLGRSNPPQVQLGQTRVPPAAAAAIVKAPTKTPPTVVFKPAPVYTAEAREQHIEGSVTVHIRVTATGQVQVIGVTSGLGHGLDQSALQVCQGMRFKPAVDANGNPVDWEGNVKVSFQLA